MPPINGPPHSGQLNSCTAPPHPPMNRCDRRALDHMAMYSYSLARKASATVSARDEIWSFGLEFITRFYVLTCALCTNARALSVVCVMLRRQWRRRRDTVRSRSSGCGKCMAVREHMATAACSSS